MPCDPCGIGSVCCLFRFFGQIRDKFFLQIRTLYSYLLLLRRSLQDSTIAPQRDFSSFNYTVKINSPKAQTFSFNFLHTNLRRSSLVLSYGTHSACVWMRSSTLLSEHLAGIFVLGGDDKINPFLFFFSRPASQGFYPPRVAHQPDALSLLVPSVDVMRRAFSSRSNLRVGKEGEKVGLTWASISDLQQPIRSHVLLLFRRRARSIKFRC